MKKMTIRVKDYVYDKVSLIAKQGNTSANKIIASVLEESIFKSNDIDYSKELNKKLNLLIGYVEKINKRQICHFEVSKQHFANRAFLSNATIRDDKCLNEIFRNTFHD